MGKEADDPCPVLLLGRRCKRPGEMGRWFICVGDGDLEAFLCPVVITSRLSPVLPLLGPFGRAKEAEDVDRTSLLNSIIRDDPPFALFVNSLPVPTKELLLRADPVLMIED